MSDELPQTVDLPPAVRLRRAELAAICLQHIVSGIDLSLAVTEGSGLSAHGNVLAGYTQWGAMWRDAKVNVRWNWGLSQDLLFVLNPAAIKANILLLNDAGATESFMRSRAHLLEWIEALAWQDTVRNVIAQLAQQTVNGRE